MASDTNNSPASDYTTAKGGLYGGAFNSSSLPDNVRAVLMDYRWTTAPQGATAANTITYAFATSITDFTSVPGYPNGTPGDPQDRPLSGVAALNGFEKAAIITAFNLVKAYTGLNFIEVGTPTAAAASFRFARFGEGGSVSAFPTNNGIYSKSDARRTGDTFLGTNGQLSSNDYFGTDQFNSIIHEMGHAFGLKHGHDGDYNGALSADRNDNEFSVMTYASYLGSVIAGPDGDAPTEAVLGSAPQSYMMYDIAALQAMYGVNMSRVGTSVTYKWVAGSGQQQISTDGGVTFTNAPDTGVTATNKIFSTVWTQGALATYDLSNFTSDQNDDLRPGAWLTFSTSQLANLNKDDPTNPDQRAQGNIYNALLYNGDTRSEISNLITGIGNDTLHGNDLANSLQGGAGNDTLYGEAGNDALDGGTGADTMRGGTGADSYVVDNTGDKVFEDYGMLFATPAGWTIRGTADFNGDGQLDALAESGLADQIWLMNNGVVASRVSIKDFSAQGWSVTGVADENADGYKDILYTHIYLGLHYSVYLNQTDYLGEGSAPNPYADALRPLYAAAPEIDTVTSSVSYTLTSAVENLTLAAGAGAIDGWGSLDNNTLTGNASANSLYGLAGDDTLLGNGGDDALYGGAGNDTLDGGIGADTMTGGAGNDSYFVDNAGDRVIESGGASAASLVAGRTVSGTADFDGDGETDVVVSSSTGPQLWLLVDGAVHSTVALPDFASQGWDVTGITDANGDGNKDIIYTHRYLGLHYAVYMNGATYNGEGMAASGAVDIVRPLLAQSQGIDLVTSSIDYSLPTAVENLKLAGGAGAINGTGNELDNEITGNTSNNVLTGGRGNDTLIGGGGSDTFAFARGDGNDRLTATLADGADIATFAAGVGYDQLWFQHLANDLVMSVIGQDQAITVANWYIVADNRLGQVVAGDGHTVSTTGIEQLVQAMSAFSPPPSGQTTLPTPVSTALAPALAANWV